MTTIKAFVTTLLTVDLDHPECRLVELNHRRTCDIRDGANPVV